MKLQENKYAILKFINEWLNVKLKSLTEFKFINKKKLLKDTNHNITIIMKYIDIFNSTFNMELNINSNTDVNEIDNIYIINLLKHLLKLFNKDYKLIKQTYNSNTYYTIKKIN
jgi:hypothetical protein